MSQSQKYFFIYKTTCIITGKFYIGMHITRNLDDGYLGSGTRLRYSVNKYGKENFIKEILEFLPDKESLSKREAEIVNEELLQNPLCINLTWGGNGNWSYLNSNSDIQRKNAQKANEKMEWLRKNDIEWCKKTSLNISNGQRESYKNGRIIKTPDWTGKTHSEKTKELLKTIRSEKHPGAGEKNSQFGTILIHNLELKKCTRIKKERLDEMINQGWIKGGKFKW